MTKIQFTSNKVVCSHNEWTVELDQLGVELIAESIDTETLIAELESRGYSVTNNGEE